MSWLLKLNKLIRDDPCINSQMDLSRLTGINARTLSKILSGSVSMPSKKTLTALAKYFNCTEEYFLGVEEGYKMSTKLRSLMKEYDITGYKLSVQTGVSRELISKILQDKINFPTDKTVLKLAQFFSISSDEFRGIK